VPAAYFRRAVLACRDNALREAALRPSRFSARSLARDLDGDVLRPDFARERSRCACFLVRADAVPFFGGLSLTPERRALERPIAMACFVERAPCFPLRTCSISSWTKAPACVVGALPWRLALRACASVLFSGIHSSQIQD